MSRTTRLLAGTACAALFAFTGVAPPATAGPAPISDRYAGRSGSQVAELSILGRRAAFGSATAESELEAIGAQLRASATGLGSTLAGPATTTVARFDDAGATGGKRCATPPVADVIGRGRPQVPAAAAAALPAVDVAPVCSDAAVTGDANGFTVSSLGGDTVVSVKLAPVLGGQVKELAARLDATIKATPVGRLVPSTARREREAVTAVNGLLGSIAPGVALPDVEPNETVGSLLDRIGSTDLVRIHLTKASARNAADVASFVSEALTEGGTIEVLPDLQGPGRGPLLHISVAGSQAGVTLERAGGTATPALRNTVLRIRSALLPKLPLTDGLPLGRLAGQLGLQTGADWVEVGPGQSLSLLCTGPAAPLCSEVSVASPVAPATGPDGLTRVETATATIHLFKGLDRLPPPAPAGAGTVLADPAITAALEPLASAAGLTLGESTGVPGIRLTTSGAVAEAGATRVAGEETARAVSGSADPTPTPVAGPPPLPRTGLPFSPATVPVLGAAALGLLGVGLSLRRSR